MKTKTLTLIGMLLLANAAKANPLQIAEAREELARINSVKSEAKVTLDRAKAAYKALNRASSKQEHALKLLVQADAAKQAAQRNSLISAEDNGSAYFADNSHGYGAAKLVVPSGS